MGVCRLSDKAKFSADQLVSSTQAVRNFSKVLDDALSKPLFIQREQVVRWVLLSLNEYERIISKERKVK
jgi:hypothetical protein